MVYSPKKYNICPTVSAGTEKSSQSSEESRVTKTIVFDGEYDPRDNGSDNQSV